MTDPYLYPHTNVLINKANIKDKKSLEQFEGDLTIWRLSKLEEYIHLRKFDFNELCQLHHYIFQDVYEWAGKPRIINIEKYEQVLGGLSVEYTDCFDIEKEATIILKDMKRYPWEKTSFDVTVKKCSEFMAALWKVHSFREGNTRTVVTFCNQFLQEKGYQIDIDLYKNNAEYVRTALVAASAFFYDLGDKRKPEYLERIVYDSLKDGWPDTKSIREKLHNNKDKIRISKATEQRMEQPDKAVFFNPKNKGEKEL